ncbi:MAG: hypothetical protein GY856_52235, partial [bacterium]|nr:hypothetical protein [bacterium]
KAKGAPVIPGTGIKGAVRTLYEILSFSCDPHRKGECQGNIREKTFSEREYCDACSLFGCMGWRGRISFSDAVAVAEASVNADVRWVATPWEPHGEKTRGDFRLYDLADAVAVDRATGDRSPAPKDLAREAYDGSFSTRFNFWNVSEEELGRILLAMGVAGSVEPVGASLVRPRREEPAGEGLRELWTGWMTTAKASPWGEAFAPKLRELAKILKPGTG